MTVESVQLSELSGDPANVRRHSERNIEALIASLRRFGQQIPLIVDANNVVRVGNARLEAMKRLGWTTALVTRTDLTGADLIAYAVADNRTGDTDIGSSFDPQALGDVLTALRAEDDDLLAAAGYTPDELATLVGDKGHELADAEPPAEFPEVDEDIQTEHQCPKCHYRWSGNSAPTGGT